MLFKLSEVVCPSPLCLYESSCLLCNAVCRFAVLQQMNYYLCEFCWVVGYQKMFSLFSRDALVRDRSTHHRQFHAHANEEFVLQACTDPERVDPDLGFRVVRTNVLDETGNDNSKTVLFSFCLAQKRLLFQLNVSCTTRLEPPRRLKVPGI